MRAGRPAARSEPAREDLRQLSRLRFRSEEHTSELQSQSNLVCRLLLEKKKYYAPQQAPARAIQPALPIGFLHNMRRSLLDVLLFEHHRDAGNIFLYWIAVSPTHIGRAP